MWAFMKAIKFENMSAGFVGFQSPTVGTGQPQRFIPVFDDYRDAEKFAGADIDLIVELKFKD